jgi:hypothetical protein
VTTTAQLKWEIEILSRALQQKTPIYQSRIDSYSEADKQLILNAHYTLKKGEWATADLLTVELAKETIIRVNSQPHKKVNLH